MLSRPFHSSFVLVHMVGEIETGREIDREGAESTKRATVSVSVTVSGFWLQQEGELGRRRGDGAC